MGRTAFYEKSSIMMVSIFFLILVVCAIKTICLARYYGFWQISLERRCCKPHIVSYQWPDVTDKRDEALQRKNEDGL